jgi:hypothetical protein
VKRFIYILSIFILTTTSCEKYTVGDCFKSTGPIKIEERSISGFHTVLLKDNIDLVLLSSSTNSISVEAGENLLSKIKTSVDDSVLIIENNNSCNWVRAYDSPLKAYLNFTRLDTIEYRSIGNISSTDTVFIDSLVINVREGAGEISFLVDTHMLFCNIHYGTADIKMKGITMFCSVYSASFGLVDNRGLMATQVYLNNKSSNDVYVKSNDILEVTIENIGNVYYTGSPNHISLNKIGAGELIKIVD